MKRFSRTILLTLLVVFMAFAFVGCKSSKVDTGDLQPAEVVALEPAPAAETPAPAPAPVEAPAPVVEPAPAPVAEPAKPVEVAPVAPQALEQTIDVAGYKATIKAYDGKAYVSYPAFVTKDEVKTAAAVATKAYGKYLSGVSFSFVKDGELVVTYPKGYSEADFAFAMGLLQKELPAYVASLFAAPAPVVEEPAPVVAEEPAPVVAEAPAPAAPAAPVALEETIELAGYKATIKAYDGKAYVTYPALVTKEEVTAAAAAAVNVYGSYLKGVSISFIKDGELVVTYPKGLKVSDFAMVMDILKKQLPVYVASLFAAPAPVVEEPAPVVAEAPAPAPAPAAPAAPVALEQTIELAGYKATIKAYDGKAYVTYPAFVTKEEVTAAATAAVNVYGSYLKGVSISFIKDGELVVTYPKGLKVSDFAMVMDILKKQLPAYVASLFAAPAPVVEEPAPVVAEAPAPAAPAAPVALEETIELAGYKATIKAYDGKAYVTYPALVTKEEVTAAAAAAVNVYGSYLKGVSISFIKDGELVVTYPKGLKVSDFAMVMDILKKQLPAYVASLFAAPAPVVEEPAPVVAEAPAPAAPVVVEEVVVEEVVVETAEYPYGVTPIVKDDSGKSEFDLFVIHTNDVHARIVEGTDGSIGYAKFATLLKMARNYTKDILLLDAGDVLHGTNIANLFQGETIGVLLDMMGYDAVAPGNHDFNYGADVLKKYAKIASQYSNLKVLCANVLDEAGYLQFQPYQIYDYNGFKVAVIGLSTPDTKTKAHPANTVGLSFISDMIVNNAQYAIDLANEYADFVVVLGHIGLDSDGDSGITSELICENIDGIDLFVDGHSHSTIENGMVVNGTVIVQTGQYLNNIGLVDVHVKNNEVMGIYPMLITAADVLTPAESSLAKAVGITEVADDAEVSAFIEKKNAELSAIYDEVVAYTDVTLNGEREYVRTRSTNLSRMICTAMTEATGADFTITNGGGIRASIPKGPVTVGQINNVLPFTNTIAVVEVKGSDVYAALEHGFRMLPETNGGFSQTDLEVGYNKFAPAGERIKMVLLNGEPIDKDKTYLCCTNDFVAAGGDGYTMFGKVTQLGGMLNEVLIDYMKANYPAK